MVMSPAPEKQTISPTFALAELLYYNADVVHRNVKRDTLHRLALLSVDLLVKHTGVGASKLKALAAHGFQKDGKVHFTSARNAELVGGVTVGYTQRNILGRQRG